MTRVFIILNEDGKYDTAYADSECLVSALRRGEDDNLIDKVEEEYEEIES